MRFALQNKQNKIIARQKTHILLSPNYIHSIEYMAQLVDDEEDNERISLDERLPRLDDMIKRWSVAPPTSSRPPIPGHRELFRNSRTIYSMSDTDRVISQRIK